MWSLHECLFLFFGVFFLLRNLFWDQFTNCRNGNSSKWFDPSIRLFSKCCVSLWSSLFSFRSVTRYGICECVPWIKHQAKFLFFFFKKNLALQVAGLDDMPRQDRHCWPPALRLPFFVRCLFFLLSFFDAQYQKTKQKKKPFQNPVESNELWFGADRHCIFCSRLWLHRNFLSIHSIDPTIDEEQDRQFSFFPQNFFFVLQFKISRPASLFYFFLILSIRCFACV